MTRKRTNTPMVYSKMHELLASPSQPMPIENRRHQRMRLADALHELMHAPAPGNNCWRVISDAINLTETLVLHGEAPITHPHTGKVVASHWRGCDGAPVEIADASGLLQDAIAAMAKAGQRMLEGKPMRLDGPGIEAVREIVQEFPEAKVLMCSAMGQQALVIEAIQAGARDFVVKPFQPSRVLEAVQRVLG